MPDRPTILFSLAHPDDESFMVAGVSCKYGARGVRLVLATATLGDAGKMGDPPVCSREELPRVRESELRRAVDLLGIDSLHLLGYPDKKLSTADPGRIRGQLVRLLRRYRPALVITFDPSGFNLHPDHIAISRFTSDAIAAAADPRWLPEAGEPHRVTRLLWTPPLRPEEIGAGPPWATARESIFWLTSRPGRAERPRPCGPTAPSTSPSIGSGSIVPIRNGRSGANPSGRPGGLRSGRGLRPTCSREWRRGPEPRQGIAGENAFRGRCRSVRVRLPGLAPRLRRKA